MIELNDDRIFEIFFDSWHIPIGVFGAGGILEKLYSDGGKRQTEMYLRDCRFILDAEKDTPSSVLRFDPAGSCWCRIPFHGGALLFGPVQTGRNPAYPYEGVPEHSWTGFRDIARCLISMLQGKDAALIEKEESYTEAHTARRMYQTDREKNELNSFDELFDCVRRGDLRQLRELMDSEKYRQYLDSVMTDMRSAGTVFQFHLAKTYHSALAAPVSLQELSPLVSLYLSEEPKYRSIAAYQAGMRRVMYDFTRYVDQYRNGIHSALVNRVLLYINENLYSPVTVEEIAEHCSVSVSTLQHRFKEETGHSVTSRIRAKKIERACYFLKHTNIPCGDIAFKMGYGSQSYFGRQFKKVMGFTPQLYREGAL